MKLLSISLVAAGLLCGGAAQADEALAKAKGCLACHTVDKKLIGPMYKEVSKKYAGKKDAETQIAGYIIKGTPAPAGLGWQKSGQATLPFMPPNAGVKPDEAAKLAKWIMSQK